MTRKKIHQAPKIKNVQVQGLRLISQYFLDQPPRPTPVTFQRYHTLSYKLRCYTRISSPEKSLNNTREKIRYLFTCVWHRQSASDTSLAFRATRSGYWMNGKAFTILNPRSFVRDFFGLWLLKHWKIRIAYRQWRSNFSLEGEENQKTRRKTESYVFSGFGYGIPHSRERKSITGRFATGRFWPCNWKIPSVVRANSKTENFLYWRWGPLFVFVVIQRMFSS